MRFTRPSVSNALNCWTGVGFEDLGQNFVPNVYLAPFVGTGLHAGLSRTHCTSCAADEANDAR